MKIAGEPNYGGVVISAETQQDNELLSSLWCNKARLVSFERKDGIVKLELTPTPEDCEVASK